MKFQRVILSSDANPKFIEFWPLVSHAWQTLFGVEVWLALVVSRHTPLISSERVVCYDPVDGIPVSNQAKMARYHLAASWGDDSVVMTNDMDLLPLQTQYITALLEQRKPGELFTLGAELYTGVEAGKFTAGYLTAESSVWRRLMNPFNRSWETFVRQFVGHKAIDHKEDIARTVHHEDPETFSDESLLRALLKFNPVPVCYAPRGYSPYTARALCRSDWQFDPQKLANGTYVEAHLPRPLSLNIERIRPLVDHIKRHELACSTV